MCQFVRPRGAAAALLLLTIGMASAHAQDARYELGRRVRIFEQAWRPGEQPATRRAVSPHLAAAVSSFFRFDLPAAGRSLNEAELALDDAAKPPDAERWVRSLWIRPSTRLVDGKDGGLKVTLDAFYPPGVEAPADATVLFALDSRDHLKESDLVRPPQPVSRLPLATSVSFGIGMRGDLILRAVVERGGTRTGTGPWVGVSVVDDLRPRLDAIAARIKTWPEEASDSVDRATARALWERLEGLARGKVSETDEPAARLLDELERVVKAVDAGKTWYGPERPGEFWLTLPLGPGRRATTRVRVPAYPRNTAPRTIVVALHGAGGSENMFFDSYGAGAIVAECRRRDWFLVAPRAGAPADQVVAALAKVYPIDTNRVYLVGHSMGAAMAVQAAVTQPGAYAGMAALGGGGRVKVSDGLKALPVFVGVGTDDFALKGAKALADAFEAAGTPTSYRAYPDVEHLGIVQVALPDVFRFFDEIQAKKGR